MLTFLKGVKLVDFYYCLACRMLGVFSSRLRLF